MNYKPMETRFDTTDEATVRVNGISVDYDRAVLRGEGIAPGDCREYTDESEYDALADILRPQNEYMIYEITLVFSSIPERFHDLDETADTVSVSFECRGHRIEGVEGRVMSSEGGDVVLAGTYDVPM